MCTNQLNCQNQNPRFGMIASFFLGSVLAYGLVMALYRLHVHPLRKYPGPWFAAVTSLYEMYFTAWGAGSFEDEIDRLHQIYGEYGPSLNQTHADTEQDLWCA